MRQIGSQGSLWTKEGRPLQEDDQQLIDEAQRRPAAFSRIYRKYRRQVVQFFSYRLHDPEQSDDYAQETFVRAFVTLRKFRHRGYSYLTYLLRIARNLLVDHWRKTPTVPLEAAEQLPDPRHERRDDSIDAELIWRVVHRLPPAERTAITWFYRDRLNVRQIATRLQRTENATKLLLSRARRHLRQLITHYPFPSR